MCHLDVVHRVFGVLTFGQFEIELHLTVDCLRKEEEPCCCRTNFIKEFALAFHGHDQHLRPRTKKGAKFSTYLADEKAQKGFDDLRDVVAEDAILTSNTSTISITRLAESLKRPENFCGMHFFNPVHRMPLVEVIRGEKTSDAAVAATVSYARAMGKTPIVVNDCPGFLVNRVLFPYFGGFSLLVEQGADFRRVDKIMEKFGWPMGPAYLLDVVGMDTAVHANEVMAEGFPDRMAREGKTAIQAMYEAERLGQKNAKGFYAYEEDKKGKPKKVDDEAALSLVKELATASQDFSDEEIIARMMVPLCLETVRCLEDGIVGTPAEADMALIYGIGFPPFRGGPLRYIDSIGTKAFAELCDKYAHLGKLYEAPQMLKDKAAKGEAFFA